MGMNFYFHKNICQCCKRSDITHIGKSSFGWEFSFHATDEIRSYKDWIEKFEDEGEIRDEGGDVVPVDTFKKMVAEKRGGLNHAQKYPHESFLDDEGHSFSTYDFS